PAMPASLPAWGFRRPRRGRSPASRYGARGVNSVPAFRIADVFDEDYLYFSQAVLTPERSDAETRLITRLAGIAQGTRVLDVGCGAGRIANRLAALGAQVIGVDVVDRFLEEAETDAARRRVEVRYARADLRDVVLAEPVDVVLCWFASFGYHPDVDLRRAVDRFRVALRPGGRLLLDVHNRVAAARMVPVSGLGSTSVTRRQN